jgi:hypothetical protein
VVTGGPGRKKEGAIANRLEGPEKGIFALHLKKFHAFLHFRQEEGKF